MAINIGPSDFSWLGNLPDVYQGAKQRSQEQSLGEVDFTNPAAVSKRAGQLIAIGDIEGALKIQQAAQAARALNEQIAQRRMWETFLRNTGPLPDVTTPAVPVPTPDIPNPGAPRGPAAPAASPFDSGAPSMMAPGSKPLSELPPQLGATDRGLASLTSDQPQGMTPSEQIIAAAQGAVAPSARGPQYAQAGTPSVLPGGQMSVTAGTEGRPRVEAVPTQVPDWLKTGAGVLPGPAPAEPAAAPKVELTPGEVFGDPLEAGRRQFAKYQNRMRTMPPGTPLGVIKAYSSGLDLIAQGLKTPQDWITYQLDQRQNYLQKRPLESFGDWKTRLDTATGTADEVRKFWDEQYWKPSQAAEDIKRYGNALEVAASDPAFVTGHTSQSYGDIANAASTVVNIGQNLGILGKKDADSFGAKLENLLKGPQNTAALQDIVQGLSSKATIGMLGGSLGKQISDSDRNFVRAMSSSLSNTPGGFIGLAKIMQLLAQHAIDAEGVATQYRSDANVRATVPGMIKAVRQYSDRAFIFKRKDGSLTPQGEELQRILDDLKARKGEAPAPAGAPAAPTTYDKATQLYKDVTGSEAPSLPSAGEVGYGFGAGAANALKYVGSKTGQFLGNAMLGSADKLVGPGIVRAIPEAVQAVRDRFNPPPVNPTDVADKLAAMAGKEGIPDVSTMINLRQSVPAKQTADVQMAITQRLGNNKGMFDPVLWAENYNNLAAKARVGMFGGTAPGSFRSYYNDISNGDAMSALSKSVPPDAIAKGLSDLAGSAALAAWARAYNASQRVDSPAIRARLNAATTNLMNNLGLGGR